MIPADPTFHTAPLEWLSRKLHPGQSLRDRVVAMRRRRRKATTPDMTVLETVEPDAVVTPEELIV